MGDITHTVTFALALRNSWNDSLITSNFIFKLNGNINSPIKKTFGYYVFLDLEGSTFEVEIFHSEFFTKKLNININDAAELNFIWEVPLIPKFQNRAPPGSTNIYGEGIDPNTEIHAIRNKPQSEIQFLQNEDGNIIEVNNSNRLAMLGATLAVLDQENLEFDTFTVIKKCSQDIYKIDRKLPSHYIRGAPILKAYMGMVAESGYFSMFVGNREECHDYILKFVKGGNTYFKIITLNDVSNKIQTK